MPNYAQKIQTAPSLDRLAIRRAADAIQQTGKALPASLVSNNNSIVTVKFELNAAPFTLPQVTIPLFGPEYVRYPLQPGDKGVVIPLDTGIQSMSGLGSGTPDLTQPANLSSLVWLPIANTAWSTVDPNAVTVYGPNGVALRNTAATSTIILLPAGIAITGENYVNIVCGSSSIMMTPTTISITDIVANTSPAIMSVAWANFVTWLNTHTHPVPNVQTGSSTVTSDPPAPIFLGTSIAP